MVAVDHMFDIALEMKTKKRGGETRTISCCMCDTVVESGVCKGSCSSAGPVSEIYDE